MRPLVVLMLLAACAPKTATNVPADTQEPIGQTQPDTIEPRTDDKTEDEPVGVSEDVAAKAPAVTVATPPDDWAPTAMRKAPSLESKRGPTTFFSLGGPYEDLAARVQARAKQRLRRDFDTIDEEMVMAEHALVSEEVAWVHYGLTEWEAGPYALAFRRDDGWYGTPPIAASSKFFPTEVESVAAAEIELGPDGLEATEITVRFETKNLRSPFTVKMVCLEAPEPSCTRPWTSETRRGGKKRRGEVLYTSKVQYPGDGTIVITADAPAKDSDAVGLQRPHTAAGTFEPFR